MNWTPIKRQELQAWIERGLDAGGAEARAWFAQVSREPTKWRLHPHGDQGGGFWVVAVLGNQAIWFNDIEEGFNVSTFTEEGVIPTEEYWCNQTELHSALHFLIHGNHGPT